MAHLSRYRVQLPAAVVRPDDEIRGGVEPGQFMAEQPRAENGRARFCGEVPLERRRAGHQACTAAKRLGQAGRLEVNPLRQSELRHQAGAARPVRAERM